VLLGWEERGYQAVPESTATTVMFLVDAGSDSPSYPDGGACYGRAELDAIGEAFRDDLAPYMRSVYGADFDDPLRVPWGHVNHTVVGGESHGLSGVPGGLLTLFVSLFSVDPATGRADGEARLGSRVPQLMVHGEDGFETWITVPHGQIAETLFPSSPHVGQTIGDFGARRFRRVWLDRAEVEDNLCPHGEDAGHEHASRTVLPARRSDGG